MNQQKIGKFIQERRKIMELTQVDLAERLGVSNRTISKWENGKSLPDYSMFQDLCNELDISINELLSGEKLTNENYQKKLEENFVSTIDYNNKKRNRKIKKIVINMVSLLIIYLLYKIFIVYFYYKDYGGERGDREFPNNKEIMSVLIHYNGKANTNVFDKLDIYIPDDFKLVTDKAKSNFVMDECIPYIKNLEDDKSFDAMILVCRRSYDNLSNLDYNGISSTLFPYLDVYSLLDKYNINDTIDLIKFYEKNYKFKQNIFTSSDEIKINFIARQYVQLTLPTYDKFYYLSGGLKGYSLEVYKNGYYQQAVINYYDGYNRSSYSISFHNRNEEYFNHENSFEILNSIYKK